MAFVINNHILPHVAKIENLGRAIAVSINNVVVGQHLKPKENLPAPVPFNWYIIGMHNGFSESQDGILKDLAHACRRRPFGSKAR
eukprot:9790792-Karenia_brevis.AAC.1